MPDQLPSAILDSTNSADSLFALELDTKQRFDNILSNQQKPINYPIPDFQKDMYPNGLSQQDLLNPNKTKGTLGEAMFSPDIKVAQAATDSIRNMASKTPSSQGVGVPDRFSYDKMMDKFLNSDAGYNPYISIQDNEDFNYLYNYDNKSMAGKVLSTFGHGISRFVGGLVLKLGQTVGYTGGLISEGVQELIELGGGPKNNFMADVADNSLARWFQQQEQNMKDSNSLAVFKPKGWEDMGFFKKLGYGSFWSDEVSDGAAFMGEMIASMYLLGGLGKIGNLAKFGETAIDFGTHGFGKAATAFAKLATGADDIQGVGRWAFSVASEAAFEAADGFDKVTTNLKNERDKGLNNLTDEQIRTISGDRAAARFKANLLILSASNAFENRMIFGNLFKKNALAMESGGQRGKTLRKLIGISDDTGSLETLAQASRREYKYANRFGKFLDWKNPNSRLRFYGSRGLSAIAAEGFWEENAQLAAERLSSTDNLSLTSFTYKYGQQTIDALMGRDPEAADNIGLGGLIGIGGTGFGAKMQKGYKTVKDKDGNDISKPIYLRGERRNLEDDVQRAVNTYEEYRRKFLNFNDIYITDDNGKPILDGDGNMQIDETKAAGLIDGMNKFTSKQAAIDKIYDPLLRQHMQDDAALDYALAAKSAGIFNRALTKFENVKGLDGEQLKKLGFDPNTIVDADWLKNSVKEAGKIYDEVYHGIQPQMKKGDTKADDENRKWNLYKAKGRSVSATKISEEYRKAMAESDYVSAFSPEIDDQDNVLQEYNALVYQVSGLAQIAQVFGENGSFYKDYLDQQHTEMEKNQDKFLRILMPKILNRQLAASEEGFLMSKGRWERLYGKDYNPPMMPTATSDALLLEMELGSAEAPTGLRTAEGKPVPGQIPTRYITLKDLGSVANYAKASVSEQARAKAAIQLSMEHETTAKYAELKNTAAQNKFLSDKLSHPIDGIKNFRDYKAYIESFQKKDVDAENTNPNNAPTSPETNVPTGQPANGPIAPEPVIQQNEPTGNPVQPAPVLTPVQVVDSSALIQKLTDTIKSTLTEMLEQEDKTDVDVSDLINLINDNWDAHKDVIRSVLQKELIDKYITPLKTKLDNKTLAVNDEDEKLIDDFYAVNNLIEAMGQLGLNQEATNWLDNRSVPVEKELDTYEAPEDNGELKNVESNETSKTVKGFRTTNTFSSTVGTAQRGGGLYIALDNPFSEGGEEQTVSPIEITYNPSKTLDGTTEEGRATLQEIKKLALEGKKFNSQQEMNESVRQAMLNAGYESFIGYIDTYKNTGDRELVLYNRPDQPAAVTTYNVGDKVKINTPKDGEGVIKEDRGDKVLLEDGRQVKKENLSPIQAAPVESAPTEGNYFPFATKEEAVADIERRRQESLSSITETEDKANDLIIGRTFITAADGTKTPISDMADIVSGKDKFWRLKEKINTEYDAELAKLNGPVTEEGKPPVPPPAPPAPPTPPPAPPKPPTPEEPPTNETPPPTPPPVGKPAKNSDDEEREDNNYLNVLVDAAKKNGIFTFVQNFPEMIVLDAKGNPVIVDGVLQLKTTQGPQQEQALRQHRVLQKMGSKAEDVNFWSEDKDGNRMFRIKLVYGTEANKQKYEKWTYRTDLGKVDRRGQPYSFPKILAVITDREGNPVYFNLQGEITTKASGQPVAFPYSVSEYLVGNLDTSREGVLTGNRKPLAGGSNYLNKDPLTDIARLVQKGIDVFGDIEEVTSGRLSTFDIDNNPSVPRKASYQRRTVKQLKEEGVVNDSTIEILKEGQVWEYITDVNGKQQQRVQVGQPYLFDNRSGLAISLNTRTLRDLVYKGKPFLQGKLKELLEGFSEGEVIDEKTGLKSYSIEIDLANASVQDEENFQNLYTFLRAMFYSQDILITMSKEGDKISYVDNRSEHIPLLDTPVNYSTNIAALDVPYSDNQIDDYDDFMSENLLSGAIMAEVEKGKKEFAKVNKRITFTLDKTHAQVLDALGVTVPVKPSVQILDNMNSFVGKTYSKKGSTSTITVTGFKDGVFTIKGENGKEVTQTKDEFMSAVKKLQEVKLPEPSEETDKEFTEKIKLSKDKIKDLNDKSKESTEDDFKDDDFGC